MVCLARQTAAYLRSSCSLLSLSAKCLSQSDAGAAGGKIDRHLDGAGSNLLTHKIHIPIQTHDKVRFFIKDNAYHLREGYAYEVNNIVTYAGENLGTSERIHLIFEVFEGSEISDSFVQA